MQYVRLARELAGMYRDALWLAEVAKAALSPLPPGSPEIELIECFRDCLPLRQEPEIWQTEADYDCDTWTFVSSLLDAPGSSQRSTAGIPGTSAEACRGAQDIGACQ